MVGQRRRQTEKKTTTRNFDDEEERGDLACRTKGKTDFKYRKPISL